MCALVKDGCVSELIERGDLFKANPPSSLLDLCCGNGNLAIAAALRIPSLRRIVASDVSEKALSLAQENLALHNLTNKIELVQSDLFAEVRERFDAILCNPPYVKSGARLPAEYEREPALALRGGADGLAVVRRVLRGARAHLRAPALLLLETGFGQQRRMRALAPDCLFPHTSAGKGPVCLIKV